MEIRRVLFRAVNEELERAEAEEVARYRKPTGFWGAVFGLVTAASIVLGVNQLFNLGFGIGFVLIEPRYFYMLAALLLPLVFVAFPVSGKATKEYVPWYDVALAIFTFAVCMYFVMEADRILEAAWEYTAPNIAIAFRSVLWELGRASCRDR